MVFGTILIYMVSIFRSPNCQKKKDNNNVEAIRYAHVLPFCQKYQINQKQIISTF